MNNKDILPKVSVIIPVYNGEKDLPLCLDSLRGLDYPEDRLEIIVVDNNSTDGTKAVIERYPVVYAFESYPTSYAARNKGILLSTGELIVFTDADCVADKNWIRNLVKVFTSQETGGVGGAVLPFKSGANNRIEKFLGERCFNQEESVSGKDDASIPWLVTANACFPKKILTELGMFDKALASGGDRDFSWRIYESGYFLKYAAGAIVYHKHRARLVDVYTQFFKYGYGWAALLNKHKKLLKIGAFKRNNAILFRLFFLLHSFGKAVLNGGDKSRLDYFCEMAHLSGRMFGIAERRYSAFLSCIIRNKAAT